MSANIVMMTRHRESNGNPKKENWKIFLRTGMGPLDTRPRPLPTQRGGGNRHLLRPHHHRHPPSSPSSSPSSPSSSSSPSSPSSLSHYHTSTIINITAGEEQGRVQRRQGAVSGCTQGRAWGKKYKITNTNKSPIVKKVEAKEIVSLGAVVKQLQKTYTGLKHVRLENMWNVGNTFQKADKTKWFTWFCHCGN